MLPASEGIRSIILSCHSLAYTLPMSLLHTLPVSLLYTLPVSLLYTLPVSLLYPIYITCEFVVHMLVIRASQRLQKLMILLR